MPVQNWNDIADDFQDAFLIGNGASVAIHAGFNYPSLWQKAIDEGYISPELIHIAEELELGANFELLMRHLWIASLVNDKFDINTNPIDQKYGELRDALIEVVGEIHCDFEAVRPQLRKAGDFCQRFNTIFSLNYDFLPYWAFQDSNERNERHRYKDCFVNSVFREDWESLREPIRGEDKCTLYFYPHGALHLASGQNLDVKITANGENLLDTVQRYWMQNKFIPLFVSEGHNRAKLKSIRRSDYLSRIYSDVLPNSVRSLAVYGWSLSAEDEHLLQQIGHGRCDRIAVSVHLPSVDDVNDFVAEKTRLLSRFGIDEVVFYDANSPDCWIY